MIPDTDRQAERHRLVDQDIVPSGITNAAVLAAMRHVPRHRFVPEEFSVMAYEDRPLSIGFDQTVSQPSLVAYMVQALALRGDEKVLEIGTGSGYETAVLAEIAAEVFTIEIIEPLATRARETLEVLGYRNITLRVGDGYLGWPKEAPFDAIVVTAAPGRIPPPLLEQLRLGGRLIIPVGTSFQELILVRRTDDGYEHTELLPVRFVPMTGEAETAPF